MDELKTIQKLAEANAELAEVTNQQATLIKELTNALRQHEAIEVEHGRFFDKRRAQ